MPAQKARRQRTQTDAIALLKADHDKVRTLLSELEKTSDTAVSKREQLLATIGQELTIHTRIEEEVFYPAFRDAAKKKDDAKLYYEALEEHHVVKLVLKELPQVDPEDERFEAKMKVLSELVEHHADEEEEEMFPTAEKLGADELRALGEQMEASMGEGRAPRGRQAA